MFKSDKKNELQRKSSNSGPIKSVSDPDSEQRYNTSPSEYKTQPVDPERAVYIAIWAFEARDTDELSFDAGDRFRVVVRSGDWWTASKLDPSGCVLATGIVPRNFLDRAESVSSQP